MVADSLSEFGLSRMGRGDQITIEDLQAIIDDPSLGEGRGSLGVGAASTVPEGDRPSS